MVPVPPATSPGGDNKSTAPGSPVQGSLVEVGPWRSSMLTHQLQLQVGLSHLLQDGSS